MGTGVLPSAEKQMGTVKVPSFALPYCALPLLFEPRGITCSRIRPEDLPMSAPLVVSIPHSLGREEAMRRLKTGLTRAASRFPVLQIDEERWEEDRMIF